MTLNKFIYKQKVQISDPKKDLTTSFETDNNLCKYNCFQLMGWSKLIEIDSKVFNQCHKNLN